MIDGMVTYLLTLTVGLGRLIDDDTARDVAARWAAGLDADLGMTSTHRDEPWLRVAATVDDEHYPGGRGIADHAEAALLDELRRAGHDVHVWHAVEILTDQENTARTAHRGMPHLVDAAAFADLRGVKRQRIYQLLAERRAGKRDDFPLPVVEGYWLATEAEHYARTASRLPGPAAAPRAAS